MSSERLLPLDTLGDERRGSKEPIAVSQSFDDASAPIVDKADPTSPILTLVGLPLLGFGLGIAATHRWHESAKEPFHFRGMRDLKAFDKAKAWCSYLEQFQFTAIAPTEQALTHAKDVLDGYLRMDRDEFRSGAGGANIYPITIYKDMVWDNDALVGDQPSSFKLNLPSRSTLAKNTAAVLKIFPAQQAGENGDPSKSIVPGKEQVAYNANLAFREIYYTCLNSQLSDTSLFPKFYASGNLNGFYKQIRLKTETENPRFDFVKDPVGSYRSFMLIELIDGFNFNQIAKLQKTRNGREELREKLDGFAFDSQHRRDIFDILLQIAEGMDKAESAYLFRHNDFHPGNIMVTLDENKKLVAKVIDFGWSSSAEYQPLKPQRAWIKGTQEFYQNLAGPTAWISAWFKTFRNPVGSDLNAFNLIISALSFSVDGLIGPLHGVNKQYPVESNFCLSWEQCAGYFHAIVESFPKN